MDSYCGEESAGAAIELRLIRFAGAILEQAKPTPPPKVPTPSVRGGRLVIAENAFMYFTR